MFQSISFNLHNCNITEKYESITEVNPRRADPVLQQLCPGTPERGCGGNHPGTPERGCGGNHPCSPFLGGKGGKVPFQCKKIIDFDNVKYNISARRNSTEGNLW